MNAKIVIALLGMAVAAGAAAQEPATANPYVMFDTNRGDVYIEVFADKAPKSAENFIEYVNDDFYNGTIFHRVIPGFVAQGGGYTADFQKKDTRDPVENEGDNMLTNDRGTLAMARTADPHSGTSQFYINLSDNQSLNHSGKTHNRAWGYAVFGKVVRGMEVIDEIVAIPTGTGGPFRSDVPIDTVIVEKASVVTELPPPPAPVEEPAAEAAPSAPAEEVETDDGDQQ